MPRDVLERRHARLHALTGEVRAPRQLVRARAALTAASTPVASLPESLAGALGHGHDRTLGDVVADLQAARALTRVTIPGLLGVAQVLRRG